MGQFICEKCGKLSYSAARYEDLLDIRCIDLNCDGTVIPADDKQNAGECIESDHGLKPHRFQVKKGEQ